MLSSESGKFLRKRLEMDQQTDFVLPVVLTIAGLDASGGAGILADVRTITAFGCYPTAAITAITFQNAAGVSGVIALDSATLFGQVKPILSELPVAAVKMGMLPTHEIVREVVRIIREYQVRCLVVDPVMNSTSGYELMDATAVTELRENLLPLTLLVTPNIPEAERLVGFSIRDEAGMRRAAASIRGLGVRAVLIKGGHLETGSEVFDVLDHDGEITVFRGIRIQGTEFRGTGCILAAGITACLALGNPLEESVRRGRDFVSEAMRTASKVRGRGILFKPSC